MKTNRATQRTGRSPFEAQVAFVRATTAVGAVAIGALAIRKLAIKRGRIGRLDIGELDVGRQVPVPVLACPSPDAEPERRDS
jgi:hypothetical protein